MLYFLGPGGTCKGSNDAFQPRMLRPQLSPDRTLRDNRPLLCQRPYLFHRPSTSGNLTRSRLPEVVFLNTGPRCSRLQCHHHDSADHHQGSFCRQLVKAMTTAYHEAPARGDDAWGACRLEAETCPHWVGTHLFACSAPVQPQADSNLTLAVGICGGFWHQASGVTLLLKGHLSEGKSDSLFSSLFFLDSDRVLPTGRPAGWSFVG